jgi:hypothetical protein
MALTSRLVTHTSESYASFPETVLGFLSGERSGVVFVLLGELRLQLCLSLAAELLQVLQVALQTLWTKREIRIRIYISPFLDRTKS